MSNPGRSYIDDGRNAALLREKKIEFLIRKGVGPSGQSDQAQVGLPDALSGKEPECRT